MKLKSILAATALSAALVAAPVAAHAAYVPGASTAVSSAAVAPGEAVVFTATEGHFAPLEDVTFTLTGTNASQGAIVLASANTLTETHAADEVGGHAVAITLPDNASGSYSLSAVGQTSGVTASHDIAVAAADSDDASEGLANTGANTTAAFWFAGGLLALGAALVVVLNVVRRNRAQA